jgi:hypothetical protein
MRRYLISSMVLFVIVSCVFPVTTEAAGSSRLPAGRTPYIYVVGVPEFDGTIKYKLMSKEEVDEIEATYKIEGPLVRKAYDDAKKEWESREQEGRKKSRFPLRKPRLRSVDDVGKYKDVSRAAEKAKEMNDKEGSKGGEAEQKRNKEIENMSESRLEKYKAEKDQEEEALKLFEAKLDTLVSAEYDKQKAKN